METIDKVVEVCYHNSNKKGDKQLVESKFLTAYGRLLLMLDMSLSAVVAAWYTLLIIVSIMARFSLECFKILSRLKWRSYAGIQLGKDNNNMLLKDCACSVVGHESGKQK